MNLFFLFLNLNLIDTLQTVYAIKYLSGFQEINPFMNILISKSIILFMIFKLVIYPFLLYFIIRIVFLIIKDYHQVIFSIFMYILNLLYFALISLNFVELFVK